MAINHFLFSDTLLQCIYNILASVHDIDYRTNVFATKIPKHVHEEAYYRLAFPWLILLLILCHQKIFFYLFSCKLCMKSCLNRSSQQGRNHSITHLITSVSLNMVLMVLSWESLVFRPSFKESSDHFTACQSSHTFRKAVALASLHLYLSCRFLWVFVLFFFFWGGRCWCWIDPYFSLWKVFNKYETKTIIRLWNELVLDN